GGARCGPKSVPHCCSATGSAWRSRRWPPLSGCARAPPVPESTGRSAGCARTSWSRRSTMGNELQRLRAALLEEAPEPDAALEARILANRGEPVARWPRTAGGAAPVFPATLLGGRLAGGQPRPPARPPEQPVH